MTVAVILWAIAGLLIMACIAVLGALFTPLRISVAFDTDAKPAFILKMAVFGGLLPVVSTTGKRTEGSAVKTKRRAKFQSRKSARLNIACYAPRMLRDGPRLVSRIAACVKLEAVGANISFGLPDPADTGMIYGALTPVVRLAGNTEHSQISLTPDFNDVILNGRGHITARFMPFALILPLLSFAWTVFVSPRLSDGNR